MHDTEMHDTELIALLERAALNAAVIVGRYLQVAGTHRLAGSIGSHTDVLTTADDLTGCGTVRLRCKLLWCNPTEL